MRYLFDTHAFLWMLYEDNKLPATIKKIINDNEAKKFISIVSLWEIAVKNRIGKLPLPHGISKIYDEVALCGLGLMSINRKFIDCYTNLPLLHRDPFDGIIIATAITEGMAILTCDENIQKYDVKWIW
ncbi:MAG: type II toxin-antitoxin system VapC family toxin [Defluviitaleaceae bacterium]|nr:type II toxin-antitoxin system VapC family toxin [Defluviitaleaceae bacterium]MCL2274303.1 type II toxin-antitoxin system VapC family toxin [Defluviitaleaceae bacterium]